MEPATCWNGTFLPARKSGSLAQIKVSAHYWGRPWHCGKEWREKGYEWKVMGLVQAGVFQDFPSSSRKEALAEIDGIWRGPLGKASDKEFKVWSMIWPARGPENSTAHTFRNSKTQSALYPVWSGEGSFPLDTCWVKPLSLPVVRPENYI